jgi:Flp pilus assembly protein TadG
MVEMALVMPVFCTVILGIIEFGRAFMVCQLLNDGAREAARSAILTGSTNAAVTADAKAFMANIVGCQQADVTVAITITPYPGNTNPNNVLASAGKRDLCAITVSIPFNKVSFTPGKFLAAITLKGKSAMRHE